VDSVLPTAEETAAPAAAAHWLTREGVFLGASFALLLFFGLAVAFVLNSHGTRDPFGRALGGDFVTFWAAARLALTGPAGSAYQNAAILHAEQSAVAGLQMVTGWFYPPQFYLLVLPLGWLPYLAAYWVFSLTTLAGYVLLLRRIVTGKTAMLCLAAFPGVWVNLVDGQNGFLTASLAAAAILLLRTRPVLAGAAIGLLSIKPHLALLFVVALVALGAWRALASAFVSSVCFLGLATAALGAEVVKASIGALTTARLLLETGVLPLRKMPTAFACVRLLGGSLRCAYTLQLVSAVAAATAVWWVWRRSLDWRLRGAALMTATLLVSPYLYDYDLCWLAFSLAWMTLAGGERGWPGGVREGMLAAWLLPAAGTWIAVACSLQIGPLVLAALLGAIMLMAQAQQIRA
jgi:hypothetical protein